MLKVLGGEQEGEFKAVASGTLPSGKPVVVNSDGTVSVVGITDTAENAGTAVVFDSTTTEHQSCGYDPTNDKVIVIYRDVTNNYYGTVVVGSVDPSDNSITFGTPFGFINNTKQSAWHKLSYDPNTGKFLIVYMDIGNSQYGTAVVGTVSGNSMTFGTPVVFESAESSEMSLTYDEVAEKHVIVYRDHGNTNTVTARVAIVSGTSVSFGAVEEISPTQRATRGSAYISKSGETYRHIALIYDYNSDIINARTLRVNADNTITQGNLSGTVKSVSSDQYITYDRSADIAVASYRASSQSGYGKCRVLTTSGATVTIGSEVTFYSGSVTNVIPSYDSSSEKIILTYRDNDNSSNGYLVNGTANEAGTSFSFSTPIQFGGTQGGTLTRDHVFDTTNNRTVIAYRDNSNSQYGTAIVYNPASSTPNLTAENYIGMSQGAVTETSEVVGTESVFDTTTNGILDSVSVYDPDTQKTIIAYADRDNGDAVTAVVATINGTTLSFGTPVVAHAGSDTEDIGIAYDTTNDRVVITYCNVGNSYFGTAVVGQVSGTSITFGTPVVYEADTSYYNSVDFDANSGKVVIAYMDSGNNNYGTAIVGTVSGTSISFGTPVVFNSGTSQFMSTVYDPSSQKTVIAYRDSGTLNRGEAIVGTVSGTSISFGSVTLFDSTSGHEADNISAAYDPDTQQVIVAYREDNISGLKTHGRAVVGSVSGTSITFGDPASFNAVSTQYIAAGYDTNANKVVIAYRDRSNSDYGTVVAGSIDGTSLSFETPVVYSGTDAVIYIGASFNEAAGSFIISYRDMTSLDGTAVAYKAGYITRYPAADGSNVRLDIIGSISDNQLDLTAGEKYYVQTDGTLSTTAGSPSVLAGTAISSTELLVKT